MCMTTSAAPDAATTPPSSESYLRPLMSFTIEAPSSSAARATSAFVVSTDTGMRSRPARARSAGTRRFSSSSAGTSPAPGRVDSAPRSTMSAPWASASSARSAARHRVGGRGCFGERVGGDVDDRHHERALPQFEAPPAGDRHDVGPSWQHPPSLRSGGPAARNARRTLSIVEGRRRGGLIPAAAACGSASAGRRSAPAPAAGSAPRPRPGPARPGPCRSPAGLRARAGAPARRRALRPTSSASAIRTSAARGSESIRCARSYCRVTIPLTSWSIRIAVSSE